LKVILHNHAIQRLPERGATEDEVIETVLKGEQFPAKYNRTGFRLNFVFNSIRRGKDFKNKQIEAYAVYGNDTWIVITIIVKYY
jgi:hypothetical protein